MQGLKHHFYPGHSLYAHCQRLDDLVAKRPSRILSPDWRWRHSLFLPSPTSSQAATIKKSLDQHEKKHRLVLFLI